MEKMMGIPKNGKIPKISKNEKMPEISKNSIYWLISGTGVGFSIQ